MKFNTFMNKVGLFARILSAPNGVPTDSDKTRMVGISATSVGAIYTVPLMGSQQEAFNSILLDSDTESIGASTRYLGTVGFPLMYNGDTADNYARLRNNNEETILASAARTASVNSADFTNFNHRGAHFIIDVTAITATPSVVPTIEGKDPVSGSYYTILTGLAIVGTGTTVLRVYPGIAGTANVAAVDILPRTYRVTMTHADGDSITYSVGAALVL